MIFNGDIFNVQPLKQEFITEHVARSWYAGAVDHHPESGETVPNYTGLNFNDRYSWLKAPRYDGQPIEVGCLARVLVGYGLGKKVFVDAVTGFLGDTGLSEVDLLSTLGRTAARGIETVIIGDGLLNWLDELEYNLSTNNKQIYRDYALSSGRGLGWLEAPRGALGHWIDIQDKKIANYQMVVPTTWNLGPRCSEGTAGPLEKALVDLPVSDPANPVEVLRVIHSYDPCVACGVHVIDRENNETYRIKVL
jgi:[NiFe] hydrogenase large subunit